MSHLIDENTVLEDGIHHPDADNPESDLSGSSGGFEASPKLRARIEKLGHWRIDCSSIQLKEGDSQFHGGHATVSQGLVDLQQTNARDPEKLALEKKVDRKAMHDFRREREKKKNRGRRYYVAVKKMRVADDTDFERVLGLAMREAEILAELSHPNIVEIEGFVEDVSKNAIWLLFPWADYGNLKDFMARERWEIPERISLISDVVQGLGYLHSQDPPICHGDLKSLNVLVFGEWQCRAVITDFGSARRLTQHDHSMRTETVESQAPPVELLNAAFCASTNTITLTGNKYTLRWAAPELLVEDQLSIWSDIWALGWIAYEVMTESLPFEDVTSDLVVVERVLDGKLPSLTDNADLSLFDELCSLMNMCWKLRPTERPTADSCQESIKRMPMLAPEMFEGERMLGIDNWRKFGHLYQSRGEHARAFGFFVKAFDESQRYNNAYNIFSSLRDLAQLARLRKEYNETISLYNVIWKIHSWGNEEYFEGMAEALHDLVELHVLRNQHNKDTEPHSKVQEIQGQERIANGLCGIAQDRRLQNKHREAIQGYSEALRIGTQLDDDRGRSDALCGLAQMYQLQHQYSNAIQLYSEALQIWAQPDDEEGRAETLWSIAEANQLHKQYDEAIRLYSEVLEIRPRVDDQEGRVHALWNLAEVNRLQEQYDEAIRLYSEIFGVRGSYSNGEDRAKVLETLSQVYHIKRNSGETTRSCVRALGTRTGSRTAIANALLAVAKQHERQGEDDDATWCYSEVLEVMQIRTQFNDQTSCINALRSIAEVLVSEIGPHTR